MSKVYPEAYIYKIATSDGSKVYYGSTNNFTRRKIEHLSNYRKYINGGSKYLAAFEILNDANHAFEIVATLKNISRNDLEKIESSFIQGNPCVNIQRIYGDRAKTNEEYRKKNKAEINTKGLEYYYRNRETICAKNRESKKKITTCECGRQVKIGSLSKHKQSKIHSDLIDKRASITFTGNINTVNINNN
jgi:predicted GIY-YIG superfamily endonuclease